MKKKQKKGTLRIGKIGGKKPIPNFRSEAEEQAFWATHSAMDYAMEQIEEAIRIDPSARTRLVSIRLSERLIADLKELSEAAGLPYQSLIKVCLQKFVEASKARKTGTAKVA
jgi:predicted DNA binding CopG/RHH family protein